MAQLVKNSPAMWETCIWSLGWEDPLEKGMATHSSILAWRIPRTEAAEGLQSMGSQRVGHDWATELNWSNGLERLCYLLFVHAKSFQSCPTLHYPKDCNPPGSSVHGILQARILEWVAIPSSRGSSWPRDQTLKSPALAGRFFTTGTTREAPTCCTSFLLFL